MMSMHYDKCGRMRDADTNNHRVLYVPAVMLLGKVTFSCSAEGMCRVIGAMSSESLALVSEFARSHNNTDIRAFISVGRQDSQGFVEVLAGHWIEGSLKRTIGSLHTLAQTRPVYFLARSNINDRSVLLEAMVWFSTPEFLLRSSCINLFSCFGT